MYNLGVLYHTKIKDYDIALKWYKKAYEMGYEKSANNIGIINEDLRRYEEAVEWYLKSGMSLKNLGLIYEDKLNNLPKALEYYKLDIEKENVESIENIGILYSKKLKDNEKASAYLLTLIEYPNYTKEQVLNYLKKDLKIDNETIKKGYDLQLTMPGLPKRYKGDLGLD